MGRLLARVPRRRAHIQTQPRPERGSVVHVIVLDGTMSSLVRGCETNAGQAYRLLQQSGKLSIYYEPGLQWSDWNGGLDVMMGRGINRQIIRAYGYLASRYREGDQIYLLGYSRGGYGVRSLAGVIDRVGLVRADCATQRNVRQAYRHYREDPDPLTLKAFRDHHCHQKVAIEMIGVWDTVKSLGINAPVFWRLSVSRHAFHSHSLGPSVKHGFQALALNETRVAYRPVLWETDGRALGRVEQVWFPGTHGDVGGHLDGDEAARPLSNIPFVWLMARAEECGLSLPKGWNLLYTQDVTAPSVGKWRGYGRFFITRRRRIVGRDPSERVHESVPARQSALARQSRLGNFHRSGFESLGRFVSKIRMMGASTSARRTSSSSHEPTAHEPTAQSASNLSATQSASNLSRTRSSSNL